TLNAVVSKQYEEALKEAEKEDYLGKPFAGVPFLLKDLGQNEKGQPSSAGSRLLAGRSAGHTDTYVQRLKDLGFIIVGRTNTPEFGFK
ncbi:amidase family protein, partial [Streptococcus suis]